MIADYSSYLELLAAVYVSMILDVDTLNRLWYPDSYYRKIEDTLRTAFPEEDVAGGLNAEIVLASKNNADARNSRMRRRALFMLALTAIMLALVGYESSFGNTSLLHEYWYNAVLVSSVLGVMLCLFGGPLFDKWNTTTLGVIGVIASLSVLMFVPVKFCFSSCEIKYYDIIIVSLLTLPVLLEILSRWLFSSVYSGYLRNYVFRVKNDYEKAIKSLKASDKRRIPKVYRKLINESIYSSHSRKTLFDICIQGYVDIRNKKLKEISRYPNGFILFFSWLGFKINRFGQWIKKSIQPKRRENGHIYSMISNSFQSTINSQDVVLNYQKEYDAYLIERSKRNGKLGVKEFCQIHGYDADAMITWLKQRNKK